MSDKTSFWLTWLSELEKIFKDKEVLLVVFGGLIFYALLYPLPYKESVPGQQAIAVVDYDRTHLARQLIRMADATPQVRVAARPTSIAEAESLLASGEVHGLLVIPQFFERDVYLGQPTHLSFAGDASYFLIYGNVVEGLLTAAVTLTVQTQVVSSLMKGENPALIPGQVMPMQMKTIPVFNPTSGYISYVVPAVFVLILHQTLLIAAGSLTIKDRARRKLGLQNSTLLLTLPMRLINFVIIYLLFAMIYFGFFFQLYGIPHAANPIELLAFSMLFLFTTTLFAIWLGYLLPRPELVIVVVLVTSLPIVFTGGFVWPVESLPTWIDLISYAFPAKAGIQGFLSMNQMAAPFSSIWREISLLIGLCFFYGGWLVFRVLADQRSFSKTT